MWRKVDLSGILSRLDSLESAQESASSGGTLPLAHEAIVALRAAQDPLDRRIQDLTLAVAEGIERVDRAERRIQASVKRARAELEASGVTDPRLDAEADGLRLVDGAGGDGGGVPAVSEDVGEPAPQASSIRGVPLEVLERVRGRYR